MPGNLNALRAGVKDLARDAVEAAAEELESQVRNNIGTDAPPEDVLRKRGFSLSPSRLSTSPLSPEWAIFRRSGGLMATFGRGPVTRSFLSPNSFQSHVGFEDSGSHPVSGEPFHRLLSYLLDGTSKLVGRPVLLNSFAQAYPDLIDAVEGVGLDHVSSFNKPTIQPISRGPVSRSTF